MKLYDVIVETPKGSAEKYNWDAASGFFKLKKILPAGMSFPYDFGFIDGTKGEDGDPLDIILLSEFKSFTGCSLECRLIGCMQARQKEKGKKTIRNDRYLAIPVASLLFKKIKKVKDLPAAFIEQLEDFFINYNKQEGKEFSVTGITSPGKAAKQLRKSFRQKKSTRK